MRRDIFVPLCLAALLCALLAGCREERQSDHTDLDAKPVLYLYPEKETEVNVRLDYDGELTCTYPACGENGWTVTAAPDGTLRDKAGQTYNYLYWEGLSRGDYDFSRGFCVPGEDTAAFLEESLEKLGLTRREANEFIVYWLPRMEASAYNLISFQSEAYTDRAKLTITPEPDSLLRVFMAWRPLEEAVEIPEQDLPAFRRKGFAAVEWGGAELSALTPQEVKQAAASREAMTVAEEETTLELPFALQQTVTLSRYDGETVSSAHIYASAWPEKTALETAFGPIQGSAVTNWTAPENPWPIYTLRIGGTESDYVAAYCGGIWLDNRGSALQTAVDFPAIWNRLVREGETPEGLPLLPHLRILALRDSRWDPRFMTVSGPEAPLEDVPMALTVSGSTLSWKITNRSGQSLSHGNGGFAALEVLLDGAWYSVPRLDGPHWGVTLEGHSLSPGKDFSSGFSWAPYAGLPDGTYRLVFPLDTASQDPQEECFFGYAAASFQLKDGTPALPGSPGAKLK